MVRPGSAHPGQKTSLASATAAAWLGALLLAFGPPLAAQDDGSGDNRSQLIDFWQSGDPGRRMNIRGRVTGLDGTPLAGIQISIRQANGAGDYTERYRGLLTSDDKGRYQFGSAVPGNYGGAKHVHVTVYQDGWEYFDTTILFQGDPNLGGYEDGTPIFLEESTVNGETIMFGRFDIVLTPE